MKAFRTPRTALGDLDAEAAAGLITAAADIVLILDETGVIRDVAIANEGLVNDLATHARWPGRPFTNAVTPESRPKVEELIADALSRREARWRHVNHPAVSGPDVPILYAALRTGAPGRIVAFGRDLRAVSSLQRRLVDAQQSMERDYNRTRFVETRYRLLFEMASDAVLIVASTGQRVLESNPAARRLLGPLAQQTGEWRVSRAFSDDTAQSVEQLLAGVRASGRGDDVRVRLAGSGRDVVVSALSFRDEQGVVCLVRIVVPPKDTDGTLVPKLKSKLLKLMESAPDAFVVTGDEGRVVTANAAFLALAQIPTEDQAQGESLERWLGHGRVEFDILGASLRRHGSVRLFRTTLRGELGAEADVEICAVTVMNGGRPCFGFTIRDVGRRLQPGREQGLPASYEHVTELIGRVSLKDLVRDATDVIERLCIEAALELTGDNRASAAEMLGLSRQSLYVKLRRFGLGNPAAEGAD